MAAKKKEVEQTVAEFLEDHTLEEAAAVVEAEAKLHVVKPKPKPGDADFDWAAEYPDEDVYVYTVPADAKKTPGGKQSPVGLTIGLCRLTEDRAPNPGEMRDAYNAGGFAPMWLFIEAVSSPSSLRLQKLLRPNEYNDMLRGWAEFAGIELGE
jgi:hypothetical protein